MTIWILLNDIWLWVAHDLVGNDLVSFGIVILYMFNVLLSFGLPSRLALAFLILPLLGGVMLGFLGWFGWLLLMLIGFIFANIAHRLMEGS